jgi:hypothetical protein
MGERDAEEPGRPQGAVDVSAVEQQLGELQRRKRDTVRWHMSRNTAERAIAAITRESRHRIGPGKPRRRKRHKRLL